MFGRKYKYLVSYAIKKGDNTGFGSLTLRIKKRFGIDDKQELEKYISKETGNDNIVILFIQELRG